MKFQIEYRPLKSYGLGIEIGYEPSKWFLLNLTIWNRVLIIGWSID